MPAQAPRGRLQVLASGLAQLGSRCEKVSGELTAAAAPPALSASNWQSSAVTARLAAMAAGNDLAELGARISARGADYTTAGAAYTRTEDESAAMLRALVI